MSARSQMSCTDNSSQLLSDKSDKSAFVSVFLVRRMRRSSVFGRVIDNGFLDDRSKSVRKRAAGRRSFFSPRLTRSDDKRVSGLGQQAHGVQPGNEFILGERTMSTQSSPPKSHRHMWLVGVAGLSAGMALMIYVPTLKAISGTLFLVAGFHLLGATVALTSIRIAFWSRWRRSRPRSGGKSPSALDFGWAPAWTIGPLLFAVVLWAAGIVIELSWPSWWPGAFLLGLLGACAFAGHLIVKTTTDANCAPLPMVDLLPGGVGVVLDGGCGAGRTSLAVASAYPGLGSWPSIDSIPTTFKTAGALCWSATPRAPE